VACEAEARGRAGLEQVPYDQGDRLRTAHAAALEVRAAMLAEQGLEGRALGDALRERRIAAIASALETDSAAVDQH
jgi:tRNA nucleotidyltransferase (CCA-adding enzyme)